MNFKRLFVLATLAFSSAACIQENPTSVGDVLLPGGDVVSFEVVLPASSFLVSDTSVSGYTKAPGANYALVANKFEGVTDANALFRFSNLPKFVSVRDSTGTLVTDTAPRFVSGKVVLKFDTVSLSGRPAKLRLYRTAEEWDVSATWLNRVDTLNAQLPWQTPGGTRGASVDTATWVSGDSVVFNADSLTLREWNDTSNHARGALVVSETPNTRIRIVGTTVHVNTKSTRNRDTTVVQDLVPAARTFVFNPAPAKGSTDLRFGGVPSWRAFLQLRSDLRSLTFSCGSGTQTCTVPLDSAHITSAQLLFTPKQPPLGFSPEDTMFVEVRGLVVNNSVPLERSPTGGRFGLSKAIAPQVFSTSAQPEPIAIDITAFMLNLTNPNANEANRVSPYLALLQLPDAATAGFGVFDPTPKLRLVLTTALEKR